MSKAEAIDFFKFALSAAVVPCGLLIGIRSASAQTWTQTGALTNNWTSVASSADGNSLVAVSSGGGIYTSTDAGITWTSNSVPGEPWNSVASSADGKILIVGAHEIGCPAPCPPGIYISTNSGGDWTPARGGAYSVTCSSDGNRLMTGLGNQIRISTNFGASWTSVNLPGTDLRALASSANGNTLATVVAGYGICTSTNSGNTWTSNSAPILGWTSLAVSADGSKLVAAAGLGGIFTSSNSGNTWTSNNLPNLDWNCVAISADGTMLVADTFSGPIYTSTDWGNTWTSNNVPNQSWTAVASSADSGRLAAVTYGGGIWTSQTAPTPQLNLALSEPDLRLSWVVPSANFVLQESPDLFSWTDVTDIPTLNFTNLQEEIAVAPTNSTGFYRLQSR